MLLRPVLPLLQAIQQCQSRPGECIMVETEKQCKEGCDLLPLAYLRRAGQGKIAGIHLIGNFITREKLLRLLLQVFVFSAAPLHCLPRYRSTRYLSCRT
jgi:hypothetical protein